MHRYGSNEKIHHKICTRIAQYSFGIFFLHLCIMEVMLRRVVKVFLYFQRFIVLSICSFIVPVLLI